jgi:hypothetical protein
MPVTGRFPTVKGYRRLIVADRRRRLMHQSAPADPPLHIDVEFWSLLAYIPASTQD